MKRLFLLVLLLLNVCTFANAQKWEISKIKGDALKGTADCYRCDFGVGYTFTCWSDSATIRIGCPFSIFNPRPMSFNQYVDVTIGLYVGDTLVETLKARFSLSSKLDTAYSYRKGLNKKIIDHLKTKGDVRIFAPKYSGDDYDTRLPMNPDIRYNEKKR